MARALRAGGGADPGRARRPGAARRAHRVHVGAGAAGQADHRRRPRRGRHRGEPAYLPALEAAGYELVIREPDWYEHRCLKGPDTKVNLHVYPAGCPEVERNLAFRDRLRADAADRDLYARTKRELATRPWTYVQQYADAKTEVITEILRRAGPG